MEKLAVIGTGGMAKEYVKVIKNLYQDVSLTVFGNKPENCAIFSGEFGVKVYEGGFEKHLKQLREYNRIIIATPVDQIEKHLLMLDKTLDSNTKILIEKPGFLNLSSTEKINYKERIFIAYNRRFLPSVLHTKNLIQQKEILSCSFDFTEWVSRVLAAQTSPFILSKWLEANSAHVLDLVFFLIGYPAELKCHASGSFTWHKPISFTGYGVTYENIPFSFNTDWRSAGRWMVQIKYNGGIYHLSPLEKIQNQLTESLIIEELTIPEKYLEPSNLKPGLPNMLKAFFGDPFLNPYLTTIDNQKNLLKVCSQLRQIT